MDKNDPKWKKELPENIQGVRFGNNWASEVGPQGIQKHQAVYFVKIEES